MFLSSPQQKREREKLKDTFHHMSSLTLITLTYMPFSFAPICMPLKPAIFCQNSAICLSQRWVVIQDTKVISGVERRMFWYLILLMDPYCAGREEASKLKINIALLLPERTLKDAPQMDIANIVIAIIFIIIISFVNIYITLLWNILDWKYKKFAMNFLDMGREYKKVLDCHCETFNWTENS